MSNDIELIIEEDIITVEIAASIAIAPINAVLSLDDDLQLLASHDKMVIDNDGATTSVTATLPPSSTIRAGWSCDFRVVQNVMGRFLELRAAGSDVIVFDSEETDGGGALRSDSYGACLRVERQRDGHFFVTNVMGPWSES